jgi:hypothetical protein
MTLSFPYTAEVGAAIAFREKEEPDYHAGEDAVVE